MAANGIKAVLFDVGGTLITPFPSVAEVYDRALRSLGIEADRTRLQGAYLATWAEFDLLIDRGRDRYSYFPGGEAEYWSRHVGRLLERLEESGRAEGASDALQSAFADPGAWAVYPDVAPTLRALEARGIVLGVVSNWDSRLRNLLASLGLADRFRTIVVSSEVGVEKPDPAIYERALRALGVAADGALHVGDDRICDYEGARAAGLRAALISRNGGGPQEGSIRSLEEVADLIDGAAGARPEEAPR